MTIRTYMHGGIFAILKRARVGRESSRTEGESRKVKVSAGA